MNRLERESIASKRIEGQLPLGLVFPGQLESLTKEQFKGGSVGQEDSLSIERKQGFLGLGSRIVRMDHERWIRFGPYRDGKIKRVGQRGLALIDNSSYFENGGKVYKYRGNKTFHFGDGKDFSVGSSWDFDSSDVVEGRVLTLQDREKNDYIFVQEKRTYEEGELFWSEYRFGGDLGLGHDNNEVYIEIKKVGMVEKVKAFIAEKDGSRKLAESVARRIIENRAKMLERVKEKAMNLPWKALIADPKKIDLKMGSYDGLDVRRLPTEYKREYFVSL